jgi:hypothetical protein
MQLLEPDRNQIEIFAEAIFRHVGKDGFASLRAFYENDDTRKPFRITPIAMCGGLNFLIDAVEDEARRAANVPKPAVFAPPVAVFSNRNHAAEKDLLEGPTLSVELDEHPAHARAQLEKLLGPATAVVASGGTWTDPVSGEIQDKLHIHWRLRKVAKGDDLAKLKEARALATRLVGGDPTNITIVHPLRWPGSWHRKGEPRLCRLIATNPDAEINLTAAHAGLTAAAPTAARMNGKNPFESYGESAATPGEWTGLIQNIIGGKSYHDSIVKLAAKMVVSGMSDGAVINHMRALMDSSTGPRDDRWQSRYDDIPRAVESARIKYGNREETGQERAPGEEPPPRRLTIINMSNWDSEPVPGQEWAVLDRFPLRQCALFTGEGSVGKSSTQLHLSAAHSLARDWLGTLPEPGPSIFVDAEDEDKVMHRRLKAIADHYNVTFKDLVEGGLHLVSLAGKDAVLAAATRSGKIEPTALFDELLQMAGDIKPKMIGIASSANVYAGSEIDRSQVQQFISLMTRIAIVANGTVNLISHPSLTGINTDTGLSGNT